MTKIVLAGIVLLLSIKSTAGGQSNSACKYTFRPSVSNYHQGWLMITLNNPNPIDVMYDHLLACPSVNVVKHAKASVTIPSGKSHQVGFLLEISRKYLKKHPDKTEHTCVFSYWRKRQDLTANIRKCQIEIITEPNGLFSKSCNSSQHRDAIIHTQPTSKLGHALVLTHMGNITSYSANTTCDPDINLIHHGNTYNTLRNNEKWVIPLYPNCSRVLDLDYSGTCRISIYNLCQQRTLVTEHSFPYFEGSVEECFYKDKKPPNMFMSLFYNDTNKITVLVAASLMLGLALSIIIIFCVSITKHDWSRGRRIFMEEMKVVFSLLFCCKTRYSKYERYGLMK